ncbi:glycerophosphodiester phosphodiesterase family protein [Sediminitomix flava]|uniref:glycerophosphodiester phosphodiesterase family protein n=1 Tax=Sediminitomix flava TaxID=379075 RepID=UPI001B86506E|nr:glycerophosphodiester phosphodiesterase family protein [Sediminitomix flava]
MIFFSCSFESSTQRPRVQGHRGCRGIYPENTLPAFQKAIELGVNTLEMDVVISKDHQVVLSHEPFFNHEISLTPEGKIISEGAEKSHNLYQMSYEEIKKYDVGKKNHPRFPEQINFAVEKPLLGDVFEMVERVCTENNIKEPEYNIEIKRVPQQDGVYHPDVNTYADLVVTEINRYGKNDKVILQSFDIETLKVLKKKYPQFRLALLVENSRSIADNINELGFIPWAYSPDYVYLNKHVFDFAKKNNVKIIPWTVNKVDDIKKVMEYPVYSIISDYPDRVIELIATKY